MPCQLDIMLWISNKLRICVGHIWTHGVHSMLGLLSAEKQKLYLHI